MTTLNPVLESTKFLVENPQYVTIDRKTLNAVAERFAKEEMKISKWDFPVFPEQNDESTVDFFLLGNSINFAFTDFDTKQKYTVDYNGEWRGSTGMWAALKKALDKGVPILDGEYLANITRDEMREIFAGNMEIPMFEERFKIFREVGEVLYSNYDGRFFNLVSAGMPKLFNGSDGIVDRLVQDIPSFDDSKCYEGKAVVFDKRAQLGPGMLYGRFRNEGCFRVDDVDELTVFADYILPKGLRDLGILRYEKSLAEKVDNQLLIDAWSREEMEIRAATVHAADMLIDKINEFRDDKINALHLDYKLWSEARKNKKSYHHLTKTTAY